MSTTIGRNRGGRDTIACLWRAILSLALLLPGSAAMAQRAEAGRYIEARDRAIEEMRAPYDALGRRYNEIAKSQGMGAAEEYWKTQGAPLFARADRQVHTLETLLRHVVGPLSQPGFEGAGSSNATLIDGGGFGKLDGLEFTGRDGHTRLLVTTRPLANDWIAKFYERPGIRDITQALAAEPDTLLSRAWATEDVHFDLTGPLPVSAPAGVVHAVAFMGTECAEDENYVPQLILATVFVRERIYLLSQPIAVPLPTLRECDERWQTLWDQGQTDAAALAFNQCYASRVTSSPGYTALVVQAQKLVNRVVR